ncbi:aminodeoxychorismate synthase component I [Xenorhabdus sp. SGI246]|uniref:aminodeoxychorismate synthase component I n=1 Tax=Xenorhabdus sp. SGI246 TaxID=3158263 RepID=UPI00349F2DCE
MNRNMQCLIINNYDSFTWNLVDYVAQVFGEEPIVIHNDEYTWEQIKENFQFDCIIVSPGPGTVTTPADFNVSKAALEQNEIPVFGVCLGFQGLAHIYGGNIQRAPEPFHGRTSFIRHENSEMFRNIPQTFEVVRYHSLVVEPKSLPEQLRCTAQTDCGLIMALEHKLYPKWGVQFHPESILTQYGMQLIRNFYDMACKYIKSFSPRMRNDNFLISNNLKNRSDIKDDKYTKTKLTVLSKKITKKISTIETFTNLFAKKEHCFWLDTQSLGHKTSRFSFMGAVSKEDVITHNIIRETSYIDGNKNFLSDLETQIESYEIVNDSEFPFEFSGGYVGFMSYEMKSAFEENHCIDNPIPDALWMKVTRFLAFDHITGESWIVGLSLPNQENEIQSWITKIENQLADANNNIPRPDGLNIKDFVLEMNFSHQQYMDMIERCKDKILAGESYEICLTNQYTANIKLDPFDLYLVMRNENPAPFGAFIKSGNYSILSTSPERFLQVNKKGVVEARPIKGTTSRSVNPDIDILKLRTLKKSEKDRAENLMIVDLMRNDLRRISYTGTVSVPELMEIESYETVHQMVSAITSNIRSDCTLIDLLRATFPGGSITGAPKLRTMEIINTFENAPRGIYCGSIGYLGFNKVMDLNIAIRSISYDGEKLRFGAGGAITYLSNPSDEFDEIMIKAFSILHPIWSYIHKVGSRFDYELNENILHLKEKG